MEIFKDNLSSDHKKMKFSSSDSPCQDASNDGNFMSLGSIEAKLLHFSYAMSDSLLLEEIYMHLSQIIFEFVVDS